MFCFNSRFSTFTPLNGALVYFFVLLLPFFFRSCDIRRSQSTLAASRLTSSFQIIFFLFHELKHLFFLFRILANQTYSVSNKSRYERGKV